MQLVQLVDLSRSPARFEEAKEQTENRLKLVRSQEHKLAVMANIIV